MSTVEQNFLSLQDFSKGRYSQAAVGDASAPVNSVSDSTNVNFGEIIGSAIVRLGTTLLGSTIASNKTPLGFAEYLSADATTYKNLVAVFSGASNATIYYFNGSVWTASNKTNLSNTLYNRMAMLGNQMFITNSTDGMFISSDGGATWASTANSITAATPSIKPSLLIRTKARLLASGAPTQSPSRVFFSSIIDPTTVPGTITWNTTAVGGDWIDVNPDDGDYNTAFAETSNVTLVFKSKGMYRLDVISKTVDTQNVFNIGAVSQEAVVNCRGTVYFFSGKGIFRTTGDFPEEISRLGVQDYLTAIPQANWNLVAAGTDDSNVYFSIGNVTLMTNQNEQKTVNNVVLKFSIRDELWSVHSYAQQPRFYNSYTDSNGRLMRSLDTAGNCQTVNLGTTDNGTPIFYELITQNQSLGDRSHLNKISDKIVVFSKNGLDSQLQIQAQDDDFKDCGIYLDGSRVFI